MKMNFNSFKARRSTELGPRPAERQLGRLHVHPAKTPENWGNAFETFFPELRQEV